MESKEPPRVVFVRFLYPGECSRDREGMPSPITRSYCSAMRLCWSGSAPRGLLVSRDSVSVCKWCLSALGLKPQENSLERKLEPTMDDSYDAVYLYSPTAANRPKQKPPLAEKPDVAVVIGTAEDIQAIVAEIGNADLAMEYSDKLSVSALSTFAKPSAFRITARIRRAVKRTSIAALNWLLATPVLSNKVSVALITQPFKSYAFSRIADPVIRATMAGASACLNTSAIPFITSKANVSFVDAGTIGWGGLKARHRILGMPMRLYPQVEGRIAVSP